MAGDKDRNNSGKVSRPTTNRPGKNTVRDGSGNPVQLGKKPTQAEVVDTPTSTRVLPNGVIVEDFSRPFQGQVNLSQFATPDPKTDLPSRSVSMRGYKAGLNVPEDPSIFTSTTPTSFASNTPISVNPNQTFSDALGGIADLAYGVIEDPSITSARSAYNQGINITSTNPEVRRAEQVVDFLARKNAPLGGFLGGDATLNLGLGNPSLKGGIPFAGGNLNFGLQEGRGNLTYSRPLMAGDLVRGIGSLLR